MSDRLDRWAGELDTRSVDTSCSDMDTGGRGHVHLEVAQEEILDLGAIQQLGEHIHD